MESNHITASLVGENSQPATIESVDYSQEVEELPKDEKNATQKKRKLRSPVWDHFERIMVNNLANQKVQKAKCRYCGTLINCDSKYGTGNLKRHTDNCVRRETRELGQMLMGNENGSMLMRSGKFCEEKFRDLLVSAIVMHNLPLSFVEYTGIRTLFSHLKNDVPSISRNTAKADLIKLHKREKHKIKFLINESPGRVSLTSDLWTSVTTDGYLSLTAHFIDKNWVLQKRILNFSHMPPPHNGVSLSEKVYGLISDWGIENKLFSLTLDNASANDTFVAYLQLQLNARKVILSEGKYFHMRCCAHILNLIVQDGLKEVDGAVQKVRDSVKYVKGSQVRKQKFVECVNLVSLNAKRGLRQDVPTRWNSTFLMLHSALYFRMAFSHLEISDSNYKHCPSKEEWERIEKISRFLKVFYDITCVFSGSKYPTSNLYFTAVFTARFNLEDLMKGDDLYMKNMATKMYTKFEKYWSEFSMILAIAVILDPRYKIQFVEVAYKKLYGSDSREFKVVKDSLYALYGEYASKVSSTESTSSISKKASHDTSLHSDDTLGSGITELYQEFDNYGSIEFGGSKQKSELDVYLDDPRLDRKTELDILQFWKRNQYRFPELAAMARDILAIPVSTVASESAFSIGGRILDQYRSSLKPEIVEGIVCCKDWLYGDLDSCEMELDEATNIILDISKDESTLVQASSTVGQL